MPALDVFVLAVLAGAFIGLGAAFATTVGSGGGDVPYGILRLLVGLAFTLGLILVVVAGRTALHREQPSSSWHGRVAP